MSSPQDDDPRDDDPRDGGKAADKGPDAFRTISEVADDLGLPQHVLRFWETRFPQIKPIKRGGGRRYYRPGDVELLRGVKELLYGQGYTIRGVQRILREQGGRKIAQAAATAPDSRPVSDPQIYAPQRARPDVAPPVQEAEVEDPQFDDAPQATLFTEARGAPEPVVRPEIEAERPVRTVHALTDDQARRLTAALDELSACRRLLEGWA